MWQLRNYQSAYKYSRGNKITQPHGETCKAAPFEKTHVYEAKNNLFHRLFLYTKRNFASDLHSHRFRQVRQRLGNKNKILRLLFCIALALH